jgi:thiamine biosynthesis lipoprotein
MVILPTKNRTVSRFATAAYAMGKNGIIFIEQLPGLEGYSIDKNGTATMTNNFEKFINH